MELRSPGVVTTPRGRVVDSHRLRGMTTVETIRTVGLGVHGDPDDSPEVLFDLWIEQDTGLPLRFEFHGAPPIGALHLFDINALDEMSIIEPADEALARNRPRVSVTPAATPDAPTDVEVQPQHEGVLTPLDDAQVALESDAELAENVPYLETVPASMDGWLRHVAPTEGYAVELPDDWEATQPSGITDGQGVAFASPRGWALEVRRRAQHGSLLDVAQRRLEDIGETENSTVAMTIGSLPAGDSARIEHRSAGDVVRVEYIVVRAKLGGRGIVYDLSFVPINEGMGLPLAALLDKEIMRRFALLGVDHAVSIP